MDSPRIKIGLTFLGISFYCALCAQTTYFVNQNTSGGQQTGLSWADAFSDLQLALSAAHTGDMIWVAQGTYKPTAGADRKIAFELKPGVQLFGGFTGTESSVGQRDWAMHETILSGNIGGPQASDNSYNVLRGEGLDSLSLLDGFVIRDGRADGGFSSGSDDYGMGGGLVLTPSLTLWLSNPTIRNCRFEHNFAGIGGGLAINRYSYTQNYLNPVLQNCSFRYNEATVFGGGVLKIGPSLPDFPFVMEDCVVSDNYVAGGDGGGMYMSKTEHQTVFRRCVFERDTAWVGLGGGLYFSSGYEENTGADFVLDSCQFKSCRADEGGGVFYLNGGLAPNHVPPFSGKIFDCLFAENAAENGVGGSYYYVGGTYVNMTLNVERCLFTRNLSTTYANSYFGGGEYSNSNLFISNCTYFDNHYLWSPTGGSFPVEYGVGGAHNGRMDARIENCVFSGNGGGISAVCSNTSGKVNTTVSNCTFYKNYNDILNKSFYADSTGTDPNNRMDVVNCVIWEPGTSIYNMFADNNELIAELGNYHIDHCLLSLDSSGISHFPIFGAGMIGNKDPQFEDALMRDFRLKSCSPAVNAGNNYPVDTLGIAYDIAGHDRIYFGTVDMGAYESPDSCVVSAVVSLAAKTAISLFPNPATAGEQISIRLPGDLHTATEWTLRDATGRLWASGLLEEKGDLRVQAPRLPGFYFLELTNGAKRFQGKIIVEK